MLDSLRKYATSWFAQLLMGLLVLSFAVWGINDVFTGFGTNDIAKVGSTQIKVVDFQRDYELAVQNLSRQLGQALTPEQAQRAGVPGQILGRLVNQATLDDAANKMGIGISNQALGQKIAEDPQFFGASGTFDRGALSQIIRSQGMTEDTFIINRRREYMRGQIAQAFVGGVAAPAAYLQAVHEFRAEERDVSYFLLTAPAVADIAEPNDTDLNAYFDAHKTEWNAPEVRALSYFVLSSAGVAKPDEVSDADAQKRYDEQEARFVTPEKRQVQQIVFKDRAEADQAATALAGGKTFDTLLTERNLKPTDVDLGIVTKDKMADPAIAEAAFALQANAISPVVDGQFGPAIVRVTLIQPAVTVPFEQAKADLKKELAETRALAEIGDIHNSIEDARAAGDTMAQIATKYDLKVVTIPSIDSNGNDAEGKPITDVPAGLVAAAFQSDVGLDNDALEPAQGTYVWYDVTAVTAPRERPIAEVRDRVVASWKDAERIERLTATADAIKVRLDNNEPIATIAADLKLEVKKAPKLTRLTKPEGDLTTQALIAVFNGPKGKAVIADGTDPMKRLVLVTDTITLPPFSETAPEVANDRAGMDGQFTNTFLGLYVSDLQSRTDVKFNQVALQQVLGTAEPVN